MVAVGFAGAISSGKTTLASAVHHLVGGVFISFGDYIRAEARRRRLDENRETLQDLGESLIVELGWDVFCRDTLAHFGWDPGKSTVIDGVRHVEVVSVLRRLLFPQPFALVLVQVDEGTRIERLRCEGLTEDQQRTCVEAHSTESQVRGSLKDITDLRVNGALPSDQVALQIVEWLSKRALR
jgi:dephospho-CoA kinase